MPNKQANKLIKIKTKLFSPLNCWQIKMLRFGIRICKLLQWAHFPTNGIFIVKYLFIWTINKCVWMPQTDLSPKICGNYAWAQRSAKARTKTVRDRLRHIATDRRESRPKLLSTQGQGQERVKVFLTNWNFESTRNCEATASCATGATITGSSGVPCRREPRLVFELETWLPSAATKERVWVMC